MTAPAPQRVLFPVRCARCDQPTGDQVCPDHQPDCGIDQDGCTCPPVCTDCCTTCSDARSRDLAAFLPADWEPGTPVLVVAGLPEGATISSYSALKRGDQYMGHLGWTTVSVEFPPTATGLVVCRPVPVPAPPATPDLTPLFDALDSYDESPSADMPDVDRAVDALVDAVRALRDGGTR